MTGRLSWDRVEIATSRDGDGCADLWLLCGATRAVDIAIAHLPAPNGVGREAIEADQYWRMILDAHVWITGAPVRVETCEGSWEHRCPEGER